MDGERAQYLLNESGQFSAVYQKHQFSAMRKRPDGSEVEVQVEILDGGPNADKRYHVSALTKDGVFVKGNLHGDLQEAIQLVPWSQLDDPDRMKR